MNQENKVLAKRLILCATGIFLSGLGIAITKKSDLGVSSVSSVANVLSIRFPGLTLGNWTIIWNSMIIILQFIILGKKFEPKRFLQFIIIIGYGYVTDLGLFILRNVMPDNYPERLLLIVVGTLVLAAGITFMVTADLIMHPGEALPKLVSDKTDKDFGHTKVFFDVTWVVLAVILSVIFFKGKVYGVREGTIISAFLCGIFVNLYKKIFKKAGLHI